MSASSQQLHLLSILNVQMNCLYQSFCRPIGHKRRKKRTQKEKDQSKDSIGESSLPLYESTKFSINERSPDRTRQETTVATASQSHTTAPPPDVDPFIPLMVGVNHDSDNNNDEMSMMSCSVMRPPSRDHDAGAKFWLSRGAIGQDSFNEVWNKDNDGESAGSDDFTRVSI